MAGLDWRLRKYICKEDPRWVGLISLRVMKWKRSVPVCVHMPTHVRVHRCVSEVEVRCVSKVRVCPEFQRFESMSPSYFRITEISGSLSQPFIP